MARARQTVKADVLVQGSGVPSPDGKSVEVTALHKADVDSALVVYVPGDIVPAKQAKEHGLAVKEAKADG